MTNTAPRFRSLRVLLVALLGASATLPAAPGETHRACPRCKWTAPTTAATRVVRNIRELNAAVVSAQPGTTILLADGEYRLNQSLDIKAPDVVLRGESGDPSKVILRGGGMVDDAVGVAISVSAPRVTVADLTVGHVKYHGIQVRGEQFAHQFTMHQVRIVDTGQQLLKGSTADGKYADSGLVACSTFEYTTSAPSDYTNGVDVLGGRDWVVRDSRFLRIRGPQNIGWKAGPAILFWAHSQNTLVERNVIIDSFRGIAFGLGEPTALARPSETNYDHKNGAIRNNIVWNLNPWADEGIEANAAAGFGMDHNTVIHQGSLPWSISIRFAQSNGKVRNNLLSKTIILRDGAHAGTKGNVEEAGPSWFVDPAGANFRLALPGRPAVDAGIPLVDIPLDFYRTPRAVGAAPDAGASEQGEPR